ncbi:TPA: hypothetical protein ACRZZI_003918 [Vibrio harveyi]
MKTLLRQKKLSNIKLLHSFINRVFFFSILAYYLVIISEEPLLTQLSFIAFGCGFSLLIDYSVSKPRQSVEVSFDGTKLRFLNMCIMTSDVKEILYGQTKRFEHTVRFRYKNQTYQDFELASKDLIEDLRFYYFLVDNQLPVKMLDCNERLI